MSFLNGLQSLTVLKVIIALFWSCFFPPFLLMCCWRGVKAGVWGFLLSSEYVHLFIYSKHTIYIALSTWQHFFLLNFKGKTKKELESPYLYRTTVPVSRQQWQCNFHATKLLHLEHIMYSTCFVMGWFFFWLLYFKILSYRVLLISSQEFSKSSLIT